MDVYVWDSINGDPSKRVVLKASKQTYNESTGKWYVGDLASDESTDLIIQLRANYIGQKQVTSSVSANEDDSDLTNNNDSAVVSVTKVSDYPINVTVSPGGPGKNTTITVTVPEDVTGDVIIYVNSSPYNVTPMNGTAILELPLEPGDYTVSARVVNDPKYADKESDKIPFTVPDTDSEDESDENSQTDEDSAEGSASSDTQQNNVLSSHATGNPILVLLLVLISMVVIPVRRKKE